ncbi:imidazolonepropionase-like domain-containing protein [Streptomyces apricus]|uniref:Aminodeoxyfutalosine deaminase/Imidazolonepropionase-like composite domain-containing protein n=1 Tax=Streptomyces apricus TaxID=1828112 RepID=A0A5B0B045_9ACTN|nr:hypothetical protein [Streptomyces apricus]KAA0935670.1 hypothetical protein FGF04_16645 [Streptomyces apricus]
MALTIHVADELRLVWDGPDVVPGGAVAVEGDRVAAVGLPAGLQERFPGARVRRWSGVLGPGLVHEGPLPGAPTPRERVHELLKLGVVAVRAESVTGSGLRAAAERNGLLVLSAARPTAIEPGGRADLAVFDGDGSCVATVCAGRLVHRRR